MRKFIVTDPCYILPSETWDNACTDCFTGNANEDLRAFDERIEQELRKFAETENAWVDETGCGDWDNSLMATTCDVKITNHEFSADAGMVCVCEVTEPVAGMIDVRLLGNCIAMFEVEDNARVQASFDRDNPDWTMVIIRKDGRKIITSQELEEEDGEDD